jgi:hypothetical protein
MAKAKGKDFLRSVFSSPVCQLFSQAKAIGHARGITSLFVLVRPQQNAGILHCVQDDDNGGAAETTARGKEDGAPGFD